MYKNEMTDERILDLIYYHTEDEKLINNKDFFYAVASESEKTSTDEDIEKIIKDLENGINNMNKFINHLEIYNVKYEKLINNLWIEPGIKPINWLYSLLNKFKYKEKTFNTQGQLFIKF